MPNNLQRQSPVLVVRDAATAAYGFGDGHPFGPDRHAVYHKALAELDLPVTFVRGAPATDEVLTRFHSADYVGFVTRRCLEGYGFLDGGDTPALPGIDVAARAVVGATLGAAAEIMRGGARRGFVPIGGLHHAGRAHAAGFCVLNDIGVLIETLREFHGLRRIAYVDIDAHHGDGVFYAYESDPDVCIVDVHEDGRSLYPGTGHPHESGTGAAAGTKLNLPLPAGAGDREFLAAWSSVPDWLKSADPDFIVLQCGADSLAGDPITHLRCTPQAHAEVCRDLLVLAEETASGRLLALGGGGYNRDNIAAGWTAVTRALVEFD